jgi:hypothetical protein
MKNFQKISDGIDVSGLLAEIELNSNLWDVNNQRKVYKGTPHDRMSDIWVRYNSLEKCNNDFQLMSNEHVPIWYPAWRLLPSLHKIVFDLMAKVEGEMLGGVLITRVPPGMGISPHVDGGWHVEYYDKFYLTLKSSEGAYFCCDHDGVERLAPKPGEIWLFDNRKIHWVENESKDDRITVIICIRTAKFGRYQ